LNLAGQPPLIRMDGWYRGGSDEAIIGTELFRHTAEKVGSCCVVKPTLSIGRRPRPSSADSAAAGRPLAG